MITNRKLVVLLIAITMVLLIPVTLAQGSKVDVGIKDVSEDEENSSSTLSPIVYLQNFINYRNQDIVDCIARIEEEKLAAERLIEEENQKVIERQNIEIATESKTIEMVEEEVVEKNYRDVTLTLTFYTGLESENGKGNAYKNARGGKLVAGKSIAMPRDIPFGSVIEIEGWGTRICDDRGSKKHIKWLNKDKTHMKVDLYIPPNKGESDKQYWTRVNNMGVIKNVKAKLYDKEE